MSIATSGSSMAGDVFELNCIVSIAEGIYTTPILTWKNSNGTAIMSDYDDITVGPASANDLPLEFAILKVPHAGEYTCEATLHSIALESPLTTSVSVDVQVKGKLLSKELSLINTYFLQRLN